MMNRIIWHWPASTYIPNEVDLKSYHRLRGQNGELYNGRFPVEANAPGKSLKAGTYAAHTRRLNTGSIGLSVTGMQGAVEVPFNTGPFPITEAGVEAMLNDTAQFCVQYRISVHERFTLSHAEVEDTLGVEQNQKWDIMWLPGMARPDNARNVGDILRERVLRKLRSAHKIIQPGPMPVTPPTLRRGSWGEDVKLLQTKLGKLVVDGAFGPATDMAVRNLQTRHQLLRDGVVGPMTWSVILSV